MSQQADIVVTQGDKGYGINFTLQDANGNPFDLTGATLKFIAQLQNQVDIKFSGTMSIISAVNGTCQYIIGATDFNLAGTYAAQIQITVGSTQLVTFDDIFVTALPKLPE